MRPAETLSTGVCYDQLSQPTRPPADVVDFAAILQASPHHVDIYLNGHVHTLNQYTVDKYGAYVTSGAGAMVWTTDQLSPSVSPKLAGLDIGAEASSSNHSYET